MSSTEEEIEKRRALRANWQMLKVPDVRLDSDLGKFIHSDHIDYKDGGVSASHITVHWESAALFQADPGE